MSYWTYINGCITVRPFGRTQAEKTYILQTVLEHLPRVTGSEGDMVVHIVQKAGHSSSSTHDEFGEMTNNLKDMDGYKSRKYGWLHTQNRYILVLEAALRDREFKTTYLEFQKWLCRLAKRVGVEDVLVNIGDNFKNEIITNRNDAYCNMFEDFSWYSKSGEINWCEYLMWEPAKDSEYPAILTYKYYNDHDNDKRVEAWLKREE